MARRALFRQSLASAGEAIDRGVRYVEQYGQLDDADVRDIISEAAKPVERMAKRMILENYKASGIQNRTGTLEKAMRGLRVGVRWKKGKGINIVATLPNGVSDYDDGGKKSNFYQVAAALNYGSVRSTRGKDGGGADLTRTSRTKLKTMALGGKVDNKSLNRLGQSINRRRKARGEKLATVGGAVVGINQVRVGSLDIGEGAQKKRVVITSPKPYMYFSSSQVEQLENLLSVGVTQVLNEYVVAFGR